MSKQSLNKRDLIDRLEQAEQALTRVSTLFEGVTIDHGNGVVEDLNATIKATIARALGGGERG